MYSDAHSCNNEDAERHGPAQSAAKGTDGQWRHTAQYPPTAVQTNEAIIFRQAQAQVTQNPEVAKV